MKLEVGKSYKTEDGRNVVLILYKSTRNPGQPFIGEDESGDVERYGEDGSYFFDRRDSGDDLAEEYTPPLEGWVNVFDDSILGLYPTKAAAESHAGHNRIRCVKVREVRE
jgi:hypothetical protein